jgi:serine/threonine protein kinase
MHDDEIADTLLDACLGAGGFGEVWTGRHLRSGTLIAVKLLHPHVPLHAFAELGNDIAVGARIADSRISRIWTTGLTRGRRAYIVAELVEGETLTQRLARCRSSSTQIADLLFQTSSALAVAARSGIMHGHLKPSNLVFVPDADNRAGERVVTLDLGTSRLVAAAPQLADARYFAPEQVASANVDGRADVYALGCIAYEMACRCPPFVARSWDEIMLKHARERAPSPRGLAPDLIVALDHLIVRMLDKEPGGRPTLSEVARLTDRIVGADAPLAETKKAPAVH